MTALTLRPGVDSSRERTEVAERLKVSGSMSARSGVAPQRRMELTVAKKLKGVVTTASDAEPPALGPIRAASMASQRASVPLAQPMAYGESQASAAACSKLATWGPRMNFWEVQTVSIASRTSSRMVENWREKSSIGTGCTES